MLAVFDDSGVKLGWRNDEYFAPPRFLSGTAGAYQLTLWVWANVVYLSINNERYLLMERIY